MLGNLTGWHLLVIGGVFLVFAAIVLAVVIVSVRLSRKNTSVSETPYVAGQIQQLTQLRDEGHLTQTEFESKLAALLEKA